MVSLGEKKLEWEKRGKKNLYMRPRKRCDGFELRRGPTCHVWGKGDNRRGKRKEPCLYSLQGRKKKRGGDFVDCKREEGFPRRVEEREKRRLARKGGGGGEDFF